MQAVGVPATVEIHMKASPPHLHNWLREAVLQFYDALPPGVADLKIDPDTSVGTFQAEIIPRSQKAARISAAVQEGDWEATVAFGKASQIDARYYDQVNAEMRFKEEVLTICRTIAGSHWVEQILSNGDKVVKSVAFLPPPVGKAQVTRWQPFAVSWLKKKTEEIIHWYPYSPFPPSSN